MNSPTNSGIFYNITAQLANCENQQQFIFAHLSIFGSALLVDENLS
jgi:hypothetical protein